MDEVNDILQTIDDITAQNPNLPVFQDLHKTYTYADLSDESNRIANFLLDHLSNEKNPIVVYGKQDFSMLASMLACTKAGRAYIPIEENTPTERFQLILDVADPALVLYHDYIDADISNVPSKDISKLSGPEREEYPGLGLDDVYYIIFTSGTTGVPKGVQITHRNLLSFVNWQISDFHLQEQEHFLVQAPFSFDLSVMSLYPALVTQSTLVPLTKDIINDFAQLFAVLPKLKLSVWVSTPSFMDICLMQPTFDKEHLPTLTHFLFCGEELTHQTAQKLRERFPDVYLYNTYGPTESTVAISQINITADILDKYKRLPIGYVKEDTAVYIMDDDRVLPTNEHGEIVIVGPSVSPGYLHNEEKTKKAFFTYQGKSAYRTGDIGHLDEEDLLHYDGRMDFQVKMHGYRIELEDVDHYLNQTKYVKQATVVPKYKDNKVQQLIAYVVPTDDYFEKEYQRTKAIKEEMAETVMDYMIPQRFIYVESLPLTTNGKIDRKGLINEVNET